MSDRPQLHYPRIMSVTLENFSLYSLRRKIEVIFTDGVFCLIGANGLGKSTFLASVNFALTGILADPRKTYSTPAELNRNRPDFADEFFRGRIKESDRDKAQISLIVQISDKEFHITRGVFESKSLRNFSAYTVSDKRLEFNGGEFSPEDLHKEYEKRFASASGIKYFEQFVFLQYFVLTFDESRKLLFWNDRALKEAVSYCIGADFEKAQKMSRLQSEMDKAGSLARNFGFQASNVRERLALLKSFEEVDETDSGTESIEAQHEELERAYQERLSVVEQKKKELADAELAWIEYSSKFSTLQADYASEFERRTKRVAHVEYHPTVAASLSQHKCSICGSESSEAIENIHQKLEASVCPLCESAIAGNDASEDKTLANLRSLDESLATTRQKLDQALKTRARLQKELLAADDSLEMVARGLREFETKNERQLLKITGVRSGLENLALNLQAEIDEITRQKDEKYAERDRKKDEYLKLQKELHQTYLHVQEEFVPRFRQLAYLFIGVDLDIRVEFRTSVSNPGINFTLIVKGNERYNDFQLSESQRFFLDIALRMALVEFSSASSGKGTLLIDTPEGSLDIAYESRVGQMFSAFVGTGHRIIMTANINSSQILKRLARELGRTQMHLHTMTEWTELSEVQLAEQSLFQEALSELDKAFSLSDAAQ